ncbi:MAG: HypC/HybG/HupF family hydrogenase formation chaperone [Nanoarchaeota archaeon]|nr:HypC/HybG/HupF family hydrogenase formation chaperone [Nanoarchaeota archaeon]
MTPQQYFLRYALPCSRILVDIHRLPKEEQEELESKLKNKQELNKEELEKIFTAAFKRIKELANKMKKDYWDMEVIKKYWLEEHNKYIEKGDGYYGKAGNDFKEICKVHKAKVIEINKNILTVSYNNKTRKVFSDLTPDVKIDNIVTIHHGFAIEILN